MKYSKTLLAVAISGIYGVAGATGLNNNPQAFGGDSASIASSNADARAAAISAAGARNQTAVNTTQNINMSPGQQTINFARQRKPVPSMANFVPMPTSPCMATIGGSGAGMGFGFSFAGSMVNENCEIQEAARNMHYLGDTQTAMEIACTGKHAKGTPACLEIAIANAQRKKDLENQLAELTGKPIKTSSIASSKERKPFDASNW